MFQCCSRRLPPAVLCVFLVDSRPIMDLWRVTALEWHHCLEWIKPPRFLFLEKSRKKDKGVGKKNQPMKRHRELQTDRVDDPT